MRVAILGGKGLLGRHLAPLIAESGHEVVVSSRSASGDGEVRADFTTGEGLRESIAGSDVVVHLVSDARRPLKTDVAGTGRLLDVMGDQHLVYVSIVGVDRHPFAYYRAKHRTEQVIAESRIRHSIIRATQFHDFVAHILGSASKGLLALIPKRFVFQPIDTAEVAASVAELVESRTPGLVPDLGGPEVHTAGHLARTLMTARGRERPMLDLPVPGRVAKAFKDGLHTNPARAVGLRTWGEYLEDLHGD